jgi:hypothetical protein
MFTRSVRALSFGMLVCTASLPFVITACGSSIHVRSGESTSVVASRAGQTVVFPRGSLSTTKSAKSACVVDTAKLLRDGNPDPLCLNLPVINFRKTLWASSDPFEVVGFINNAVVVGLVGPTAEVTAYSLHTHDGFFVVTSPSAGAQRGEIFLILESTKDQRRVECQLQEMDLISTAEDCRQPTTT